MFSRNHLTNEGQIQTLGYKIFMNDSTTISRGILTAIKEKLNTIVVEVNREDKIVQILWALLSNQKKKSQNGTYMDPKKT